MEVIVRNLHDQMTEKQVDNYFRPILERLGIKAYHCQKLKGKGCATLTFLDETKGQNFLRLHGQPLPGKLGCDSVQKRLFHLGKPVNCSLSNKGPDEYLVKALRKEESDRYAKSQIKKPKIVPGKFDIKGATDSQRAFELRSFNCGQWTYVHGELAFSAYYIDSRLGRVAFGSRCLLIKLQPQPLNIPEHQIEIPYNSVESFTVGSKSASMTFSLSEAPRFYEDLASNLAQAVQKFQLRHVPQTFKRKRISAINEAHEKVVASCLCYRFLLAKPSDVHFIQRLKKFSEIPNSITWNTASVARNPFVAQLTSLNDALAGAEYTTMPFDVKFQVQKLAQNGYLSPYKVVELMPIISERLSQKSTTCVANSLRYLASHIPFAGPNAEASDFSLKSLTETLRKSEESNLEEDPYSTQLAEQYEHIAMVHKAMVTPVGVYLYGPEPEIKNRVLRKYSAYPNHFLSVSFFDENGEQLRFDRQTDSAGIYHQRFKSVLDGVINIAGRGYEVPGRSVIEVVLIRLLI